MANALLHVEEEYKYAKEHATEWAVMMWTLLNQDLVTQTAAQVSVTTNIPMPAANHG